MKRDALTRVIASLLFSLAACTCPAQTPHKVLIAFTCTCADPTGSLFATAFRDLLAESPRFSPTASAGDKADLRFLGRLPWHISVVSIDPSSNSNGNNSALSVVLTAGDSIYLDHQIQICGVNKAQLCAEQTLAFLDNAISVTAKQPD